MATTLMIMPAEKGTAKVTVGMFTDEDGRAVVPNTVAWTLTDRDGNVVNSRSAVSLTPAASISFLLSGDDLAITSSDRQRAITIATTYDSTLGTGLTARAQAFFTIEDFAAVA